MKARGISSGVYFPVPFHLQVVYKGLGYKMGDMPNAEFVGNHSLALPMFPELVQEEIDQIIDAVNSWEG